jgi:hypothetical protein
LVIGFWKSYRPAWIHFSRWQRGIQDFANIQLSALSVEHSGSNGVNVRSECRSSKTGDFQERPSSALDLDFFTLQVLSAPKVRQLPPIRMASTAAANSKLAQKLSSIAHSWVVDPFRPNMQLRTFLNSLAAHPRLTPRAVDAARSLRDNEMSKKVHIAVLYCF